MAGKRVVMFGFHGPDDQDRVGYVRADGKSTTVVEDLEDATRFDAEDGQKWREFFNSELEPWRFHPVVVVQ